MDIINTTYILGAGFSHSITPKIPTSNSFFLKEKQEYEQLKQSGIGTDKKEILEFINKFFPESPDLEEVMSFLSQGYFPPTFQQHSQHREYFYKELLSLISKRFGAPFRIEKNNQSVVNKFISKVVKENSNIITFNYDCLVDFFLLQSGSWNPAFGYGWPLRHIADCFHDVRLPSSAQQVAMSLIKLHGSVNWGIPDFNLHDIKSSEVFYVEPENTKMGSCVQWYGVNTPLSKRMFHEVCFQPFIVPPISDKGKVYENLFLKKLWFFAREILIASERIVILGYSFPPTDYMSSFLFREAFSSYFVQFKKKEVIIVNIECSKEYQERVKKMFLNSEVNFIESDALAFIKNHNDEILELKPKEYVASVPIIVRPRIPLSAEEEQTDSANRDVGNMNMIGRINGNKQEN